MRSMGPSCHKGGGAVDFERLDFVLSCNAPMEKYNVAFVKEKAIKSYLPS